MKRFTRGQKGFTLIELLIVIIIIGILAAIAIPIFLNQRVKAKDSSVKEGSHTVLVGVQSWATDHNDTYPDEGGTLQAQIQADPSQLDAWPTNPFVVDAPDMTDANTIAGAGTGNLAYTAISDGTNNTDFTLGGVLHDGTTAFDVHGVSP